MANGYSYHSPQRELSYENTQDRVRMIFIFFCAFNESNLSIRRVKCDLPFPLTCWAAAACGMLAGAGGLRMVGVYLKEGRGPCGAPGMLGTG